MRTLTQLAIVTLLGGCIDSLGSTSREVEGEDEDGEIDRDDCKLEGDAIGQEGVTLRLGAKTVTVHDWIAKADSPGEYVGFSQTLAGGTTISYVVKAGGELHPSTELVWLNPRGDAGSEVPGISNIDYCEECEDGNCEPGGDQDPEPDPDCDNPDGCDGGGGDGDPTCDNPDGCPDSGGSGPLL
jgi:hypothetical protein